MTLNGKSCYILETGPHSSDRNHSLIEYWLKICEEINDLERSKRTCSHSQPKSDSLGRNVRLMLVITTLLVNYFLKFLTEFGRLSGRFLPAFERTFNTCSPYILQISGSPFGRNDEFGMWQIEM